MRIVVVGGSGYLGRLAVRALRSAGVEVAIAGRRGPVVVDLARPETFAALEGFDVVVDTSSSHAAAPDALARHCLDRGLVLLEASSDRLVVERLLDRHRGDREARGALVLGAGIFTGLSNLLGAHVAARLPSADRLELGVASSPFSGAGAGTVALMGDALRAPAVHAREGRRQAGPELAAGPELPFVGTTRPTVEMSFPEPSMLLESTKVPEVHLYFAPRPALLRLAFLATPLFVVRSGLFAATMRLVFGLVRRLVLRRVSSRVELVARATRGSETAIESLVADDGMVAGGVAIAAMAMALAELPPRGVRLVDEVLTLDDVVRRMRAIEPSVGIDRTTA
jgi:short subunit dehydrogenase-like uncharacterized protein